MGANITVSLDVRTTFVTTTENFELSLPDATTIGFTKAIVITEIPDIKTITLSFNFIGSPISLPLKKGSSINLIWTGTSEWAIISIVDI